MIYNKLYEYLDRKIREKNGGFLPLSVHYLNYNRGLEGQFPQTASYKAAHEMGHATIAMAKGKRVRFATIGIEGHGEIIHPQVCTDRLNDQSSLFYAAGVAGLIVGINHDNMHKEKFLSPDLYATAQWAAADDFSQFLNHSNLNFGSKAEQAFYDKVRAAIDIICIRSEFFRAGRSALSRSNFSAGLASSK